MNNTKIQLPAPKMIAVVNTDSTGRYMLLTTVAENHLKPQMIHTHHEQPDYVGLATGRYKRIRIPVRQLVHRGYPATGIVYEPARKLKPVQDWKKMYLVDGCKCLSMSKSEARRKEIWDQLHEQQARIREHVKKLQAQQKETYTEVIKTPTSSTTIRYTGKMAVQQKAIERVVSSIWNSPIEKCWEKVQEKRSLSKLQVV